MSRIAIGRIARWLFIVIVTSLALAQHAASADASLVDKMKQVSDEGDEKTIPFMDDLLKHPERLNTEERFTAQAYLCESLEDLGQWSRVAILKGELDSELSGPPADDAREAAARLMACIGFAAKQQGDLKEALARFNRAISWFQKDNDYRLAYSFLLFRRAGIYDNLGDSSRALQDLTNALHAIEHEPESDDKDNQRNNLLSAAGHLELNRGEYASAEAYYRQNAEFLQHRKDPDLPRIIAIIDAHIGEALLGQGKTQDAQAMYESALAAATSANDVEVTARAEIGLARTAVKRFDFKTALQHLDHVRTILAKGDAPATMRDADMARLEVFEASRDWRSLDDAGGKFLTETNAAANMKTVAHVHEMLAASDEAQGRFVGALAQLRQAGEIRRAQDESDLKNAIAKSRIEFDVAELDARASALDHQRTIETLRANEQQRVNRLQWGLIALTAILLVVAIVSIRRHVADKLLIRRQKDDIESEKRRADDLLHHILPDPIADRLMHGEQTIADGFSDVTVLFADLCGFTEFSSSVSPRSLVKILNRIFSAFDDVAERCGVEKIKTIGDAYMAVCGVSNEVDDHAERILRMAIGIREEMERVKIEYPDFALDLRIGVHTGPCVAGVIGRERFIYDLWGDTVNLASRMESTGVAGKIQVTEATYLRARHEFAFESRGDVPVKGRGSMKAYLLKL